MVGDFDGVVLAGGASRRFGGVDKTAQVVGGATLLDRAVSALGDAGTVVVVGPRPAARRDPGGRLLTVREDPPGSGPAAGLLAGLPLVDAPVVVVLAADLPHLDRVSVQALVSALAEAGPDVDAVVPLDADGRAQWLAAAYRRAAVKRAAEAAGADARPGRGPAMRDLVARLRWTSPATPLPYGRLTDVDTPEDLGRARLDAWARTVIDDLRLGDRLGQADQERLVGLVLDVARDAAHTVARPAAPVTTFLLGLAAGLAAQPGQEVDLDAVVSRIETLVREHGAR